MGQKYLIALMMIAVVSSTTLNIRNKTADVKSDDSMGSLMTNHRTHAGRIRRQTSPSTFTDESVPVINDADISSTSFTRVQAPEMKTLLSSQLELDNSINSNDIIKELLCGIVGALPILGGLLLLYLCRPSCWRRSHFQHPVRVPFQMGISRNRVCMNDGCVYYSDLC